MSRITKRADLKAIPSAEFYVRLEIRRARVAVLRVENNSSLPGAG